MLLLVSRALRREPLLDELELLFSSSLMGGELSLEERWGISLGTPSVISGDPPPLAILLFIKSATLSAFVESLVRFLVMEDVEADEEPELPAALLRLGGGEDWEVGVAELTGANVGISFSCARVTNPP